MWQKKKKKTCVFCGMCVWTKINEKKAQETGIDKVGNRKFQIWKKDQWRKNNDGVGMKWNENEGNTHMT